MTVSACCAESPGCGTRKGNLDTAQQTQAEDVAESSGRSRRLKFSGKKTRKERAAQRMNSRGLQKDLSSI